MLSLISGVQTENSLQPRQPQIGYSPVLTAAEKVRSPSDDKHVSRPPQSD